MDSDKQIMGAGFVKEGERVNLLLVKIEPAYIRGECSFRLEHWDTRKIVLSCNLPDAARLRDQLDKALASETKCIRFPAAFCQLGVRGPACVSFKDCRAARARDMLEALEIILLYSTETDHLNNEGEYYD